MYIFVWLLAADGAYFKVPETLAATVLPTGSVRILVDPLAGPEHSIDASAWKSPSQSLSEVDSQKSLN